MRVTDSQASALDSLNNIMTLGGDVKEGFTPSLKAVRELRGKNHEMLILVRQVELDPVGVGIAGVIVPVGHDE